MFSTSMMASSTTSPMAMARPARTIVLIVPPSQRSRTTAETSDSGMAVRLMTAVRHSKRKAMRMSDDEDAAEDHGDAEVVQRLLDERGGAEDVRGDLDVGQAGPQRLQGLLELARDFEGVGPRGTSR